ncbi:protein FAR1-RELATED SEQUENCE 4 [Andrographis paniculata]|uniref:protein FAR1-RELATED SEQUENCE 4 n=1 Tax=Andrographis paniculata TaxID=175694 RepID=UPI0021E6EE6F|nr:protein FAR1-RELATED SEQUENCE 4 [Andrographis paniculata]XP_051135157.1 protein FAR1-RELATED SEQUENCE 4 [Andrographis paniculata]
MEASGGSLIVNSSLEPRDDMEFDTHEAAYEYYKEYAKSLGFGTAKLSSRRSRASKEFIDAKFSCIRYGNKQQSDDAINPRPSPKIGCKASMHVKRRPTGKWYIHSFVKEHNHELLPAQAHFFRSHRNVDISNNDTKVRKKKAVTSMSKQYGAYQFSGSCTEGVIRNQHDRGRFLSLEEGGAQIVLEFCAQMHEENPKFFYALDFNEEHRLRNIFWVDSKGVEDFTYFSDVVSFDTTYFANKYRIPLVLFIGVNHHIQPTLLGCGLIADDTVYTFIWLFQSWCLAMGGRSPNVLLTDQSDTIKAAVQLVCSDTRHYIHLWNILEKIPRQLGYLSIWHDPFMEKLNKCIYRSWNEEQYEKRWWKLIERFNLREDEWFQILYEERKLWVPVFIKDVSFAGLSAASRAESLNSFFDKYIHGETSLREFIEKYKSILEDIYEEEAKANFDAWHETPEVKSPSPFEKQMLFVCTHEIFKKFQMEVLGAAACHLKKEKEDGSTLLYGVKDFENNQDFIVEWNEHKSDIYCSCRSFEYKGYLCRHAIVVLQMSGVFSIPFKYILQRWTNAATSRIPLSEKLDEVQAKVRRYNDLCRRAIILGEEGSLSQESYNAAVEAISNALKQCSNVDEHSEDVLRPIAPSMAIQVAAGVSQDNTSVSGGQMLHTCKGTNMNKGSKRTNLGKEPTDNGGITSKKGKVPIDSPAANPGTQGIFQHMDLPGTMDYHALYPRFLTTLLKGGEMSKRSVEMLGEILEEQS